MLAALPDALRDRIRVDGEHWIWTGTRHPLGYGSLTWQGRTQFAHRVVYTLLVKRPGKRQCHHCCDRRDCVNPAHIELVTQKQHSARHGPRTHCKWGHEYTRANVYVYKGERRCRECQRRRDREAYARKLALRTNRL